MKQPLRKVSKSVGYHILLKPTYLLIALTPIALVTAIYIGRFGKILDAIGYIVFTSIFMSIFGAIFNLGNKYLGLYYWKLTKATLENINKIDEKKIKANFSYVEETGEYKTFTRDISEKDYGYLKWSDPANLKTKEDILYNPEKNDDEIFVSEAFPDYIITEYTAEGISKQAILKLAAFPIISISALVIFVTYIV